MMISVVIPVYNAEQYIGQLLKSILIQSFQDFEIIVVDDGSTDNTINVLKAFKDHRLRIFSKQNGGVSSARNFGIHQVNGEFVVFPDADDTLKPNMLDVLHREMIRTKADICICAYNNIHTYCNTTYIRKLPLCDITENNLSNYVLKLSENQLFNPVWNKMYRLSILHDVKFENITFGEDAIFNLDLISKNVSLHYVDEPLYNYYSRGKNNCMNVYHLNFETILYMNYQRWKLFFKEFGPNDCNINQTLSNMYIYYNWLIFRNLFLKNSPYNFSSRTNYIRSELFRNSYFKDVLNVPFKARKSIIFYLKLYQFNSPFCLNVVYTILFKINKYLKHA